MITAEKQTSVVLTPTAQLADWICLDTETGDAPAEAIADAVANWKAPKNWKAATVEAKREEYAESIRERAALLDASPILCVGIRTPSAGIMFSGMSADAAQPITGWCRTIASAKEAGMLEALAYWLNSMTSEVTNLVGHNIRNFDLPKLRGAYVRHRMHLPWCLRPRLDGSSQTVTDTSALFRHFSMEHRDDFSVSLDTACRSFGIPRPKQYVSGADVPRLHREGRYDEIMTYCAIDVEATTELYLLMTA